MIAIRLFSWFEWDHIFFIVLQRNCKLKQILMKKMDKRKVLLLRAIELKKAIGSAI